MEAPKPLRTEVARHGIDHGPELWMAERTGEGPVGIALVFPRGAGGEGGIQALAGRVGVGCAGPAPVLGAGPDYEILSVSRAPGAVLETLDCLGELLAATATATAREPEARGSEAAFTSELEAYRSASGILLATLYAPAQVPGGSLGTRSSTAGTVSPSHVVVVGPVDVPRVTRRADAAFKGLSDPSQEDADSRTIPRPPVATEVLVLNQPGERLADVRVGQLTLPGDHPDWSALVVAREILADRLQGGPWAFAELLRVRGPGAFIAGSRLPLDAAADAVDLLMGEVETLRTRLPSSAEVLAATSRLSGSFTTATGQAPALANELARVAALGLGPEAVLRYPERLAALTPSAVRQAARGHLDPSRLLVAARGDGPALAAALAAFGPVRSVRPPTPPDHWPALTVDGSALVPGISRYRVRIGGQEVGVARREVFRISGGRIGFRASAEVGGAELLQEATATLPALDFVEGTTTTGGDGAGSLRRQGDRLIGTRVDGGPVALELPVGAVVADLLEPTLWASTLESGANYRIPVTAPDGGSVGWAAVRVLGRESVTVPAGTFETLRVEVIGPEVLTLWLQPESPHRTVRLVGANGVVLELLDEGSPEASDGVQ